MPGWNLVQLERIGKIGVCTTGLVGCLLLISFVRSIKLALNTWKEKGLEMEKSTTVVVCAEAQAINDKIDGKAAPTIPPKPEKPKFPNKDLEALRAMARKMATSAALSNDMWYTLAEKKFVIHNRQVKITK